MLALALSRRTDRTARKRFPLLPLALALGIVLLQFGLQRHASAQSLLELYQAARGYDATYLSAKAQAESVAYAAAQAEASRLPSVAMTGNSSRAKVDYPGMVPGTNASTSDLTILGKQPLFNRSTKFAVEQARKSVDVARYDLAAAEQDLIVRVAQAYFDVLAAQDTLSTAGANKAAISEQLASAKRNFEVGTATITDTREAQARYDLAVAQELIAENDLRTKRIFLDQLVGKPNTAPKPLIAPVELPAMPPIAVDDWVTRADEQHPAVLRARLGYETARLETEKARAGHLPTLDAVGTLKTSHGLSNTSSGLLPTVGYGNTNTASIGLQLNVPLFSGFAVQNRVKETLLLEEKARNDLESALRQVATATRQTYYGVLSGQAQVKALEAAESSSQLALDATKLGYKVGVRVNLDVLNAQTQLYTAQRDLAKARYDVLVNELKLRQASGQLNPGDVSNMNDLFVK